MIQYYFDLIIYTPDWHCCSVYVRLFMYSLQLEWDDNLTMWHYNVRINISIAVCDIIMSKYCIMMCEYVGSISKYHSVQLYPYNARMLWGFLLSNISHPQLAAAV